MLIKFAILAVLLAATWVLISIVARPHWNAGTSCSRVIGPDGVECDSWSFTAGYANTLLGRTVGRFEVARAQAKYSRQQRKRKAIKARASD